MTDAATARKNRKLAIETKSRLIPCTLRADAVERLIERVAGREWAERIALKPLTSLTPGVDRYRVADEQGAVTIEATSGVAAAAAFNRYLRQRCGSYIGPLTRRVNLPDAPPAVGEEMREDGLFAYRYCLNYCTYGYTMPFWSWEQWEPFLDYMMLSGYNLVFNFVGNEEVWRRALLSVGYSGEEARRFLAGPAFFPWQGMMNLTGWGGAAPQDWYDGRVALARRINERLASFGAGVMLPGFSGMVPGDWSGRFPGSHPLEQGDWCGFARPSIILPDDAGFSPLADAYYTAQKALFGGGFHYFSTDPFHEGGNTAGVDLAAYARLTYAKMTAHYPDAVWFLQGWQINPRREMLAALEPQQVLVGNLLAEKCADGGDDFAHYPWLYCTVNNFGGQRRLQGHVLKMLREPYAYHDSPNHTMVGVGLIPEGVAADEILFDILASQSVSGGCPEPEEWLRGWLTARYGSCPPAALEAWRLLAREVYVADTSSCPRESSLCARPSLTVKMVSSWSEERFNYPTASLERACRLLFSVYGELKDAEPYRFDLTDLTRQAVANYGWQPLSALQEAYARGNDEAFEEAASRFLALFPVQEALTGTSRHMMLGPWLEEAKACGRTKDEQVYFEWMARTIITVWGDRHAAETGGLREYAAREWDGTLSDLYRPRWETFFNQLRLQRLLGRETASYDFYDGDCRFTLCTKTYPTSPQGDLRAAVAAALALLGGASQE